MHHRGGCTLFVTHQPLNKRRFFIYVEQHEFPRERQIIMFIGKILHPDLKELNAFLLLVKMKNGPSLLLLNAYVI